MGTDWDLKFIIIDFRKPFFEFLLQRELSSLN